MYTVVSEYKTHAATSGRPTQINQAPPLLTCVLSNLDSSGKTSHQARGAMPKAVEECNGLSPTPTLYARTERFT